MKCISRWGRCCWAGESLCFMDSICMHLAIAATKWSPVSALRICFCVKVHSEMRTKERFAIRTVLSCRSSQRSKDHFACMEQVGFEIARGDFYEPEPLE